MHKDIFQYTKAKETDFNTQEIKVGRNWMWSFQNHVQMIFHLKHSQYLNGNNDFMRPFKAVMLPMLNLAYWVQDIDVKDGVFWVDGEEDIALSFLIKKYHDDVYIKEHDIDELIDNITESDIDYGGTLIRPTNGDRPEVVPLTRIAFCDQVNVESGAVGFRFDFSADKLMSMSEKGWGDKKNGATITLDELVTLAETNKKSSGGNNQQENESTSKSIEVYIIQGSLPEAYLKDNDNYDKWTKQVQVIAFYQNENGENEGVTLFRSLSSEETDLLFHSSNKVDGRALGLSEGETLIHPQVWTNYSEIHKAGLIEASSKTVLYTDDEGLSQRNNLKDMDNLEIAKIMPGGKVDRLPTSAPDNIQLLQQSIDLWMQQAQLSASAQDPILGKEAVSGTTFKGQERTVAQGRGYHDRQRGKRAKFIEKIYRKIIIPDIIKEIVEGKEFLASLSSDEVMWVSEKLAEREAGKRYKQSLFDTAKGNTQDLMTQEELDTFKKTYKDIFRKKKGKHLLKILEKEFDGMEDRIGISFANKQKDVAMLSDKVLSVFQFIFANPSAFQQAMQIPALSKSFQSILEFSGIDIADFQSLMVAPQMNMQPQQQEGTQTQDVAGGMKEALTQQTNA